MKQKKIFNTDSTEEYGNCRIINGNPNGIINFNKSKHKWAYQLYKNMINRTWFPEQVNITKDKKNYPNLSPDEKRMYDLVLAQLITNDSIQTNQLMDKFNCYITSPVVNACLARQAYEETSHSDSYTLIAEEICQDTDRIYNLHKEDEELMLKNKAVEEMYAVLYQGTDPSNEDILMACVGNQILEELVFPGGFAAMHSLEVAMPGTSEMISEIQKDETLSHVLLFKNIFRTIIEEEFNGVVPTSVINKATDMIKKMNDAEIRWTKYVSKGILGFSDRSIETFINYKANSVCKNLLLPTIYEVDKVNPLNKLLINHLSNENNPGRQNFFEQNVLEYNHGGLKNDW